MPRRSLIDLIESRRGEVDQESSERYVDLMVDVFAEDADGQRTGERLGRFGGLWDRRLKDFIGDAKRTRTISIHAGQRPFFEWWAAWLRDYLAKVEIPEAERIYSALLGGGQRAGKTWIAILPCVLFAIEVPGSIVWIVSPTDKDHVEAETNLRRIMPASWYVDTRTPWYTWKLVNGSEIVLRSAHKPESLKKGDAAFVLLNEAQQQDERAFAIARGRIAEAGGLVILAANPPSQPIGQWVGDFASEAQAGQRQAKFFHLDPFDNPHIDHGPLLSMAKEFDAHTFDVEIRGRFLGARNAVLYNWDRTENERTAPLTGDITPEVTLRLEGHAFDRVAVVDVQRHPWMASAEVRFFENPRATVGDARVDWCHLWFTSELFLPGGDEEALAIAWLESGWDPARTLVVCDASGEWQFAERDPARLKALKERVRGRGSFDVFGRFGFRVVKPDRSMEKNPDVLERVRATTSRIRTAVPNDYGQRFVFADPRCRELCKAIRNWPTKGGAPHRASQWAHGGDVVTYACQRFFPRREPRGEIEVKIVRPPNRGESVRGW